MAQRPYFDAQVSQTDLLLVTVTEIETMAVRRLFSQGRKHFIGDKTYYELGERGDTTVFLVQSEMDMGGAGGAIRTVEKGIELLSPSAVIMIGIAFGVDPVKQQIGDIQVSERVLDYEVQRVSQINNALVIVSTGDKVSASTRLLNRCRDGAMEWQEAGEAGNVHFGLLLSGSKLVDHQDFREQLRSYVPEAIGGEMEGVGLYAAAQGNKVDWIVVKAISDWADGNKAQGKQARQQLPATRAARFVVHVIQQGGLRRERPKVQEALAAIVPNVATRREGKRETEEFDVFLCYSSEDRAEVKKIALALQASGILPWFDEWALIPGQPWQRAIEEQIRQSKAAAVFVGPSGMGPWHSAEMYAFLRDRPGLLL